MDDPVWTYDAKLNVLNGPHPVPQLPPQVCISAEEVSALDHHNVIEVTQDVRLAIVGTGYIPADSRLQRSTCVERPFYMKEWKGAGWYARYRRHSAQEHFVLTHVWADEWKSVHFTPWC